MGRYGFSSRWFLLLLLVLTSDLAGVAQARTFASEHGKHTTHHVKLTSPLKISQSDFEEQDLETKDDDPKEEEEGDADADESAVDGDASAKDDGGGYESAKADGKGGFGDSVKAHFNHLTGADETAEERKKFRRSHLAQRIQNVKDNVEFWKPSKEANGTSIWFATPSYSFVMFGAAFFNQIVNLKVLCESPELTETQLKQYSFVLLVVTWGLLYLVFFSLRKIIHFVSIGDRSMDGSMMSFIFQFIAATVLIITALVMETAWMKNVFGGDGLYIKIFKGPMGTNSHSSEKIKEFGPIISTLIIVGCTVNCIRKIDIRPGANDDFVKVWILAITNVLMTIFFAWLYFEARGALDGIQIDGHTGEENLDKWGSAFYFSVITQSTVGYGDVGFSRKHVRLLVMIHTMMIFLFAMASGMSFVQAESDTGVDVTEVVDPSKDDEETQDNKRLKNKNAASRDRNYALGTVANVVASSIILFKSNTTEFTDATDKIRNMVSKEDADTDTEDAPQTRIKSAIAVFMIIGNLYGITTTMRRRRSEAMRGRRDLLKVSLCMGFVFAGCFTLSAFEANLPVVWIKDNPGVLSTIVVSIVFMFILYKVSTEHHAHSLVPDHDSDEEFLGFIVFALLHLVIIYGFAWGYYLNRMQLELESFFAALTFAVITHSTVGFGQVPVKTMLAKSICMTHAMVVAVLLLGGIAAVHVGNPVVDGDSSDLATQAKDDGESHQPHES